MLFPYRQISKTLGHGSVTAGHNRNYLAACILLERSIVLDPLFCKGLNIVIDATFEKVIDAWSPNVARGNGQEVHDGVKRIQSRSGEKVHDSIQIICN